MPVFDGVASIFIGLLLTITASLLARESKSLLIGERADVKLSDSILQIANSALEFDTSGYKSLFLIWYILKRSTTNGLFVEFG